jgi:hypothetical protein
VGEALAGEDDDGCDFFFDDDALSHDDVCDDHANSR